MTKAFDLYSSQEIEVEAQAPASSSAPTYDPEAARYDALILKYGAERAEEMFEEEVAKERGRQAMYEEYVKAVRRVQKQLFYLTVFGLDPYFFIEPVAQKTIERLAKREQASETLTLRQRELAHRIQLNGGAKPWKGKRK